MTRRVLSLWQPWATFTVIPSRVDGRPAKEWETRHFRPRFPLPIDIAIHATKRLEKGLLERWPFTQAWRDIGHHPIAVGQIIGVATIVEVRETEELAEEWPHIQVPAEFQRKLLEYGLGNYEPARFAWRLENARPLPRPFILQGRQDVLWQLPEAIDQEINEQLAA